MLCQITLRQSWKSIILLIVSTVFLFLLLFEANQNSLSKSKKDFMKYLPTTLKDARMMHALMQVLILPCLFLFM